MTFRLSQEEARERLAASHNGIFTTLRRAVKVEARASVVDDQAAAARAEETRPSSRETHSRAQARNVGHAL